MKEVKIKKYKLIKTYPTSPKLGSEVDVSADADPYKDFPDNWEDITPVKLDIPLFKTEDGVDIFEGDKVYFVNITNQRFNIDICLQADLYKSHLLYFSTKEKAEEYILMNKPCLSINNVLGIYNDPLIKSQLIKLIKNKK